jgi:hypothetical protein
MREIWKIYRVEGIEELDFRRGFKPLRGAYFNDEYGVTVMLAGGMPDEPTIFTMAHELQTPSRGLQCRNGSLSNRRTDAAR